jgi:hypothetical protein
VQAWASTVLPGLKGIAKPLFQRARLMEGDGSSVVVGVPNAATRERCEAARADVEAALAARFGQPIPVRIVVDATADQGERTPAMPSDDDVPDPAELVDAPDQDGKAAIDRLTEAFPGATWETD